MLIIKKSQRFYDPDATNQESDLSRDVDFGDEYQDDDFNQGYDPHHLKEVIDQDDLDQYLEDNEEIEPTQQMVPPQQEQFQQLEPLIKKDHGIPAGSQEVAYADPIDLAYDAIKKQEIVSFDYYFLDNDHNRSKGISNMYAGHYYIEPYFTFFANTGNELLIGWQTKGVTGKIKAFGLTGIRNGIRHQNATFEPREELTGQGMPGQII